MKKLSIRAMLVLLFLVLVPTAISEVMAGACYDVYQENLAACRRDYDSCMIFSGNATFCQIGYESCKGAQWSAYQYCRAWMGDQ